MHKYLDQDFTQDLQKHNIKTPKEKNAMYRSVQFTNSDQKLIPGEKRTKSMCQTGDQRERDVKTTAGQYEFKNFLKIYEPSGREKKIRPFVKEDYSKFSVS